MLLLAVPVVGILSQQRLPPSLVGAAALAMLGTGVLAQVAALPAELDASFRRALPMLRAGVLNEAQTKESSRILAACSLTYVASSLVAVLNVWPWLGRPVYVPVPRPAASALTASGPAGSPARSRSGGRGSRPRPAEPLLRAVLKPLIRGWLRLSAAY